MAHLIAHFRDYEESFSSSDGSHMKLTSWAVPLSNHS